MAKKAEKQKPAIEEWMYTVINAPHVTEKSTMGSEHGQVSFLVPLSASKPQIKKAVEALWEVKVKGVNTLIQKGKNKRFRGFKGRRSDFKKAMVTLEEGQVIDTGTGL